jgi:NitT/TauT family transport system ATP-binding protein
VVGESGIGKTTLLRILMGLEKADSGSVTGIPDKISAVFQEDRLLEKFDVVSNIRLTCGMQEEEIRRECERLLGREALCKNAEFLSGGQRRRAVILRAMLADSKAVFLDEPFTGLDMQTKEEAIQYILEKQNGRTIFIITHDKAELERIKPQQLIHIKKAGG